MARMGFGLLASNRPTGGLLFLCFNGDLIGRPKIRRLRSMLPRVWENFWWSAEFLVGTPFPRTQLSRVSRSRDGPPYDSGPSASPIRETLMGMAFQGVCRLCFFVGGNLPKDTLRKP